MRTPMTATVPTNDTEWRTSSSVIIWNVTRSSNKEHSIIAMTIESLRLELAVKTRCRTGVVAKCIETSSTGGNNEHSSCGKDAAHTHLGIVLKVEMECKRAQTDR